MNSEKFETSNRQIRFITKVGILGNVVLSVVKVVVGVTAGSISLVADGVHSASDMATDFAVLIGAHLGCRQPDERHPYGHGRIETLAAAFIGVVLAAVGCGMIYRAAKDIAAGHIVTPRFIVLWVAGLSILIKELLYRLTRTVAIRTHSSALYANAWHHRSDAMSSVAVVVGFISERLGFIYGDQLAAVAVGLMIVLVAARVLGDCLREFTETATDPKTIEHIKSIISRNKQVRQWHKLRTRMVGREIFLDLHILVEPELTVAAAHGIAEKLEQTLHQELARPANIMIHIEPDTPQMREVSASDRTERH